VPRHVLLALSALQIPYMHNRGEHELSLYVPEIDKKIELFSKGQGREMAHAAGALLLGQLPMDPTLAKLCDEGNIERYDVEVVARLGKSIYQSARSLSGGH
jgi:hypothetical protein